MNALATLNPALRRTPCRTVYPVERSPLRSSPKPGRADLTQRGRAFPFFLTQRGFLRGRARLAAAAGLAPPDEVGRRFSHLEAA